MTRPITLFTGQWTDLNFEEVCKKANNIGFDGLEIACWGKHLNIKKALTDNSYLISIKEVLENYNLKCWALSNHLAGQCVGALYDKRIDNFVPQEVKGNPIKIKEWAIQEMKLTSEVARIMGCKIITGFTGSPIWNFFYSFPQTGENIVEEGFKNIVDLWTPIFDEFDKNGIKFALEVHPTEIAFDFYTTKRLIEKFDYRNTLGINFDPSHLLWQGIYPHLFIREFSEHIYHVHMKDIGIHLNGKEGILGSHLSFGNVRRGWNFRSLGHGDVDFENIIRELNDIKYNGPLSIEWEDNGMDRDYGLKQSYDFAKKINFNPSTVAFDSTMGN